MNVISRDPEPGTVPDLDIRTIQEVDSWARFLHCTRGELLAGLAAVGANYEALRAAIARNRQISQPSRKVLAFSRDPLDSMDAGFGARIGGTRHA